MNLRNLMSIPGNFCHPSSYSMWINFNVKSWNKSPGTQCNKSRQYGRSAKKIEEYIHGLNDGIKINATNGTNDWSLKAKKWKLR
jgi:hypothetical protein